MKVKEFLTLCQVDELVDCCVFAYGMLHIGFNLDHPQKAQYALNNWCYDVLSANVMRIERDDKMLKIYSTLTKDSFSNNAKEIKTK